MIDKKKYTEIFMGVFGVDIDWLGYDMYDRLGDVVIELYNKGYKDGQDNLDNNID